MGIEEIFVEAALEPTKTENKILSMPRYVKLTGGGIYWAILYWLLYGVFLQEIIRRQEKLDYVVIGVLVFFTIGLLLSIGVYLHIQFFRRYRNNIDTWTNEKEIQLAEERQSIEKDCITRINKMAAKLNAVQFAAMPLYNHYKTHKQDPFPPALDDTWNKLYDVFDPNKQ